ncbi:MAG: hypothetical protein ACRYG4_25545 [Janthinobacterium lividum]
MVDDTVTVRRDAMGLQKDDILDGLAELGNVAQFVAYRPGADASPLQSHSRLIGRPADHKFASVMEGLVALFDTSSEGRINVRSYEPGDPRSREFVYGVADAETAVGHVIRLCREGLNTIANETIDIHDGGVSGVQQGDLIEFAPDDTPRCVEKEGAASLPFALGMALLQTVYGFRPDLTSSDDRTEFSVHPRRCGTRAGHTLRWEREVMTGAVAKATMRWPNRFSRLIGDKAFGLLMAHLLGQRVPRTTVIGRRVAPFSFGQPTGSAETWLRTCPSVPEPGLFTTTDGWTDPYHLLSIEDPDGTRIPSVISQSAVEAVYSGAAIYGRDGLLIEGRLGKGDGLMLGREVPQPLTENVIRDVQAAYQALSKELGAVRVEWVHDGREVWIVQLHVGATQSSHRVIVPGDADRWESFEVADGLVALRNLLKILPMGTGVEFAGEVGLTSHLADLMRKARIPTRFAVSSA